MCCHVRERARARIFHILLQRAVTHDKDIMREMGSPTIVDISSREKGLSGVATVKRAFPQDK
jgi:hypothetical protein